MNLKRYSLMVAVFYCVSNAQGQEIKIGQKIPDIVLKNVINYSDSKIKLSDLHVKLVILDFWGTGCGGCIDAFPKIDSIQKIFSGEMMFIAVNRESKDSTTRFFKRMRHIRQPAIPFVTGDSILSVFFPHSFVPHHVWIDSSGTVRFITAGHNATVKHIQEYLNSQSLELAETKYEKENYFETLLMSLVNHKHTESVLSYSVLMQCNPGVMVSNTASSTMNDSNLNLLSQNCSSVEQLYVRAYSEDGRFDFTSPNTVQLEVKNNFPFRIPADENLKDLWIKKYSYVYELRVPPSEAKNLYKEMQKDLVRYFGLQASVEKKEIECLVLERSGSIEKLKTKGQTPASNFWVMTNDSIRYLTNQPFDQLVNLLNVKVNQEVLATPFVNEANCSDPIDIKLDGVAWEKFDIETLRQELKTYGLDLVLKRRLHNVLVIKEVSQ